MAEMVCGADHCDSEAVAALYVRGSNILVRVDHLYGRPLPGLREMSAADMRCMECLLHDIQGAVTVATWEELHHG